MSKKRPLYPPEFRRQMIELVRAGRSPEDLAKEFEPSAQAIRNWVAQADRDEGRRSDGLTCRVRGTGRGCSRKGVSDRVATRRIGEVEKAGPGWNVGDVGDPKHIGRAGGVSRRRFVTTTVRDGGRQAPDLVQRSFTGAHKGQHKKFQGKLGVRFTVIG